MERNPALGAKQEAVPSDGLLGHLRRQAVHSSHRSNARGSLPGIPFRRLGRRDLLSRAEEGNSRGGCRKQHHVHRSGELMIEGPNPPPLL